MRLGWSFFQDRPEHTTGVDFEPCGYFRKRNWFKDTDALIVIGPQRPQPPSEQVYRSALTWAVACFDHEHQLMWQVWGLMGGIGFADENVLKFADPAIRKQMVPIILQARYAEAEAAHAIGRTLAI